MARPLLIVGVSYAVARWAAFFLGNYIILSISFAVVGLAITLTRRPARAIRLILFTSAIAFGVGGVNYTMTILPLQQSHGRQVQVQGLVLTTNTDRLPSYQLTMRASFPYDDLPDTILRVRGWGEFDYQPGDAITALVELEELLGSQNFHSSRGVFVSGRMISHQPLEQISLAGQLEAFFLRRQMAATENIRYNIPANADMVAGMTMGETDGMDGELLSALSRAGVIHMVVVSGMHLSILVGVLEKLLGRLGVGKTLTAISCMSAAASFAMLVGLSPSVVRAVVMLLVYKASKLASRRSDSLSSVGFSLLVISLAAPHWLLSRGLWLSFSSTLGIIVLSGPLTTRLKSRFASQGRVVNIAVDTFLGAGAATLSAYAFSLPVMIVGMGWVSLVSPLVNVLVAPFALPVLVFGLISAATTSSLIAPFALVADFCAGLIADIARIASGLPFATFALSEFWMLIWVVSIGVCVGYLCRKGAGWQLWRYSLTLIALTFAIGQLSLTLANNSRAELVSLDGVSTVMVIRGQSAVVVGTPSMFEMGRLTRYLDFRGVERVEAIIAHDHGNQVNSAVIALVDRYDIPLIVGPPDDYILGQISLSVPGVLVASGENYFGLLDGMDVRLLPEGGVMIGVGGVRLLKTGEEYYGITHPPPGVLFALPQGSFLWPPGTPPAFEPLGGLIFGETRVIISI